MRFKGLDLNLLVALRTFVEERSVSRAAIRLGLSQPAASSALARLRLFFGDEILVARGKRMFSTPFAESLLPQIEACLGAADTLIATSRGFDPSTSSRVFRIIASDYIVAAVLAPMAGAMVETVPNVGFEFIFPDPHTMTMLDRGEVDVSISPADFVSGNYVADRLFDERHVVVGRRGHALFCGAVTEAAIFSYGHIAVRIGAERRVTFGDHQLALSGRLRRIEVIVSSFTAVPWVLLDTNRLAIMHERLAVRMRAHLPVDFAPLPFDFPIMREMIQYHPSRSADEGLKWLIDRIRAEIADPSGPPAAPIVGRYGSGA